MKKMRSRRVTAMAMAVMMAASAFSTTGTMLPVYAAETTTDAVVFPSEYTQDMVKPMKDEEQVEKIVNALVKAMTDDEKWTFMAITGTGKEGNAGDLPGVARLGIPRIKMYDGPAGLLYLEETTNVPEEQLLAATWSEEMAEMYGEVYSNDNKAMGGTMMLSAELDIQRHPFWSRTKDQMGADSYLLSSLADDLVTGMQSEGGIAVMKHFAVASDDGALMQDINQTVDEQTLHELYLPGFESAIKDGDALGLMTAYNKTNGDYSSSNQYLLIDVLRNMWGYKYFTITDWGGNHSFTIDDGTDIEAPNGNNNNATNAAALVADGTYTQEEMDEMLDTSVARILRAYAKGGYLSLVQLDEDGNAVEGTVEDDATIIDTTADTTALKEAVSEDADKVETIAEEGAVLLKNENDVLPIDEDSTDTVAMIGTNAMSLIPGIGGERSYGTVSQMTSPYEAMTDILGTDRVDGEVYNDLIGTIIPADHLYTTADGNENGVIRTYGTGQGDESGEFYQGQYHSNTVNQQQMGDHEIGEYCTTDTVLDFNTSANTGSSTYKYEDAEMSEAFGYESAYTWNTYVEADETGSYDIILQSIGATASLTVYQVNEDGSTKSLGSASGGTDNQGTNWYDSDVSTKTGENVSTATVNLEEGNRYLVVVSSANKWAQKDMQVGLAWVTPSQKQANIDNAIQAAKDNDTVVIFTYTGTVNAGSTIESCSLKLSSDKENMINTVAEAAHEAGNKVVVVLNNAQQIVMEDWIDNVDGILEMYYPGQRGGVATAKLLTGEVNPSGHLAYTIPAKDSDTILTYSQDAFDNFKVKVEETTDDTTSDEAIATMATDEVVEEVVPEETTEEAAPEEATEETTTDDSASDNPFGGGGFPGGFPGFGGGGSYEMTYTEGIFTDYRFFDKYDIEPQYSFGYGLSYTTFAYSDVKVEEAHEEGETAGFDVTFTVTNTGDVAGKDVAQIYLGAAEVPEGVQMAEKQLAGYQKTEELQPGESQTITIHVSQRTLSYWNTDQEELTVRADGTSDKWTVATGERDIILATSENDADTVSTTTVNVQEKTDEQLAAEKRAAFSKNKASISSVKTLGHLALISAKSINGATKYQFRYVAAKYLKNLKSLAKNIKTVSSTSRRVLLVLSKGKYYAQTRAYKTIGGKKAYTSWSAIKSFTVK